MHCTRALLKPTLSANFGTNLVTFSVKSIMPTTTRITDSIHMPAVKLLDHQVLVLAVDQVEGQVQADQIRGDQVPMSL